MFKDEKELFNSNLKNHEIAEKLYYYFSGDSDNEVFSKIVQKFLKNKLKITLQTLYNYKRKHNWNREYKKEKDNLITDTQIIVSQFDSCINEYLKGEKPITVILQERGYYYSMFDRYTNENIGNLGTKWNLAKDALRQRRGKLLLYHIEQRLSSGVAKESIVQSKFVKKVNPMTGKAEIIAKPQRKYDKIKELPLKELVEAGQKVFPELFSTQVEFDTKPLHELSTKELSEKIETFDNLDAEEIMPEE